MKEKICVCSEGCVGEVTVFIYYMREQTDQRNTWAERNNISNMCSNWHVGLLNGLYGEEEKHEWGFECSRSLCT